MDMCQSSVIAGCVESCCPQPRNRTARRVLGAFSGALIAVGLGVVAPAEATSILYRTDGELVAISDRVVHGRVVASRSEIAANGQSIRTITTLAVLEDLTGVSEATIDILELGGRAAGRTMWVAGGARFIEGQEVLVCLERRGGRLRSVAMAFSAFSVQPGPDGAARLHRFSTDADVVGAPVEPTGSRTLSEFRQLVSAIKGTTGVKLPAPAMPKPGPGGSSSRSATGTPIGDAFTLLGDGVRWQEVDTGAPVLWYRNADTPSPLLSGNVDAEIQTALTAWTAPAASSISLSSGGTRRPGGRDVFCSDVNLSVGLISFEDPTNELPSGVLAVGGGCSAGPIVVVNGRPFESFTHAFAIMNSAAELGTNYRTPPNFTRVVTHEIGHGVGLGHVCEGTACTTAQRVNLMFPSCCYADMPIPPAIGPDDLAGIVFIYPNAPPPPPPQCSFTIAPTSAIFGPQGGSGAINVTASAESCARTATSALTWISITSGASGTGSGTVSYLVAQNVGATRSGTIAVAGQTFQITQDADTDGDMLPDAWETSFGLSPASPTGINGASGDPDSDGSTNLQESQAGTHPRGFSTRFLAEGVINNFFQTEIALLNPTTTPGITLVRVQPQGQSERSYRLVVPGRTRRTLTPATLATLTSGPFSAVVESDAMLIVDRTMAWGSNAYGAHAEAAVTSPAATWYLAEGSTSGAFTLFYLLQNPAPVQATAIVTYLLPWGQTPITKQYTLPPTSRTTIPVDSEHPALASTDVSAVISATHPIIVERAMYLDRPGEPFAAGHGSAGVTAPSLEWFLAEGATGPFFELFILVANPNGTPAQVTADYLLPNGQTISKAYVVPAQSRFSIWVDDEQFPAGSGNRLLENAAVSTRVRSTNGVGVIVERAMWWPAQVWHETHGSPGATTTGTRWALAGGEVGGSRGHETYILVANTSDFPGQVEVTLFFEDGTSVERVYNVPAHSRTNVPVSSDFPASANKRFGALIESLGVTPVQIVVERAMYWSAGGATWAAGTAALATRLP
jgi:hypothetical protein